MDRNISRKSFLCLCAASALSACARRHDFSILDIDAETRYPPLGEIELVNDLNFHSFVTGSGSQSVIFIHGANINLRDWVFANSKIIQTQYKSIYVDRPGFGYSERPNSSWSAAKQAEQIRKFTQLNNINEPILVGHSWGSLVALEWILAHPDEVKGFVSVSGVNSSFGTITEVMSEIGIFNIAVEIYSRNLAKNVSAGSIERFAKRVFSPQKVPEKYLEFVGPDLSRRQKTILANNEDLKQTASTLANLEKRYSEIRVPVEVIHGKKDWLLDHELHGQAFADELPLSNLTLLDGVGHMAHHASPYAVNKAINRIID